MLTTNCQKKPCLMLKFNIYLIQNHEPVFIILQNLHGLGCEERFLLKDHYKHLKLKDEKTYKKIKYSFVFCCVITFP